jgi:hypothetical protein
MNSAIRATMSQGLLDPIETPDAHDVQAILDVSVERSPIAFDPEVAWDYLHRAVCAGTMSLHAAQVAIATNWVKAYCDAKLSECPARLH